MRNTNDIAALSARRFGDLQAFRFVFDSMAEGVTPYEAYVDDTSALLWDRGHCFYVGGTNGGAGRHLADLFRQGGVGVAKIMYCPEAGEAALAEAVGEFRPRRLDRALFVYEGAAAVMSEPSAALDFAVRPVDERLLGDGSVANKDGMVEEIEGMWGAVDRFLQRGFGYCAVADGAVAGWCTAEYVGRRSCGIGIETAQAYRNRGVAGRLTYHFLRHCSVSGITPYWDCWSGNGPSVRTAEKLGFRKLADYKVLLISK